MTEIIGKLFGSRGLGEVISPVIPVSGGFMHKMYKVCAGGKLYAVKHLNSEIMKRPGVMENYEKAEKLERVLEKNSIPIVPALIINNVKMQEQDGEYFYIFNWQEGSITDWNAITIEQCRKAGNIQGKIHAIDYSDPESTKNTEVSENTEQESDIPDFKALTLEAKAQDNEIYPHLAENESLLKYAVEQMVSARKKLPDIETIIDDDMDPKNVMWYNDDPVVIDLECLDHGNPVSSVIQLSLQWAGVTTCSFDPEKMKAFFEGYHEAYDNGFRNYAEAFGLAYTWVEWLEYNIGRALGKCADEDERCLGVSEVKNTVARIKYIRDIEESVKMLMR